MARGWESKSVEEQQSEAMTSSTGRRQQLTPEQLVKRRQQGDLLLARKHILDQLQTIQNSRHRKMLEEALAELDTRLAQLG
jgi:uncharacterized protein YjcR